MSDFVLFVTTIAVPWILELFFVLSCIMFALWLGKRFDEGTAAHKELAAIRKAEKEAIAARWREYDE